MNHYFQRTELLIGKEALEKLSNSHIAVFGVGGVGGYTVEALVRSGIGNIDIIDNDIIDCTNINRQIIATAKNIGEYKVDAFKKRILEINPQINVRTFKTFYLPETSDEFDLSIYDYIVDAIDTVTGKIELAVNAQKSQTPIISSMGTGNKLHPTHFEVSDIYKTQTCPLARVMRRELKRRNVNKLKVVYSKEIPLVPKTIESDGKKKQIPGSIAFVPSVAGLIIAGEVLNDIISSVAVGELSDG